MKDLRYLSSNERELLESLLSTEGDVRQEIQRILYPGSESGMKKNVVLRVDDETDKIQFISLCRFPQNWFQRGTLLDFLQNGPVVIRKNPTRSMFCLPWEKKFVLFLEEFVNVVHFDDVLAGNFFNFDQPFRLDESSRFLWVVESADMSDLNNVRMFEYDYILGNPQEFLRQVFDKPQGFMNMSKSRLLLEGVSKILERESTVLKDYPEKELEEARELERTIVQNLFRGEITLRIHLQRVFSSDSTTHDDISFQPLQTRGQVLHSPSNPCELFFSS